MFCILLEYRYVYYFLFCLEKPKSHFLVFWQMWRMARRWHGFDRWQQILIFDRRTKEQVFGSWAVKVGTSACSVRGFLLTQITPIPPKAYSNILRDSWDYNPMFRTIGYAIRWNWGGNLQSPSMLSGHRPLYSETVNNIFAVTGRHVFLFWFLCSYV